MCVVLCEEREVKVTMGHEDEKKLIYLYNKKINMYKI